MEAELHAALEESLKLYMYANASFYAERLFALFPSPTTLYALARTFLESGDPGTCLRLLQSYAPFHNVGAPSLDASKAQDTIKRKCWYLLGVACVQASRISEAESAFLQVIPSQDGAAEYWLGVCCKRLGRQSAAQNFTESWKRNPMLFASYEELVKLQKPPVSIGVHGAPRVPNGYSELLLQGDDDNNSVVGGPPSQRGSFSGAPPSSSGQEAAADDAVRSNSRFSAPPPPRSIPATTGSSKRSSGAATNAPRTSSSPPPVPLGRGPGSPLKRSLSNLPWGTQLCARLSISSGLVQFLSMYADVVSLLGACQCQDAIRCLVGDGFPERDSGWCLSAMAMSYFHLGATTDARTFFERMRQLEPWRLHDPSLVYYSTTLWHLRDEQGLGHLTQVMMEEAPLHVVTLCVAGNCYSLAKDARMATQMLMRATTVDKTFAYAHTLLGYELLSVNDSGAEAAFVQALARDARHYIALAGLGEVAYRKENLAKAQHYFALAIAINRLPTIMNRLASTYHRRGASMDSLRTALDIYDRCLQRSASNVGARHQRAEVLMRLRRFDDALHELERLRVDCPEEAALFMSLGRCTHKLGRVAQANQYYHKVLDLDPRRSVLIKGCLERLQQNLPPDEDE